MGFFIPAADSTVFQQQMQRYLQESVGSIAPTIGSTSRPDPPRSLIAQPGSLSALITWNSPQNTVGIVAYNIYLNNENNKIDSIDVSKQQYIVTLPASTPTGVYVSSMNGLGIESIKVQIIAKANSNQLVTSGTGGGTGGVVPVPPPDWPNEPTGGGGEKPDETQ